MGFSREELEGLYRRYAPVVFRRARRFVALDAEAWDVVQEVFEKLLVAGDGFRREARPMTWVYRITTHVALNHLRARGVRDRTAMPAPEPSTEMSDVEARNLLSVWAQHLTDRELSVATLLYVDGLTQEEVADVLGLSRKTIGREVEALRQKVTQLETAS
jgi:RNA polymerase sigma-70 factor (ECF subfamily)